MVKFILGAIYHSALRIMRQNTGFFQVKSKILWFSISDRGRYHAPHCLQP